MWEKEKFCRSSLIKKIFFLLKILFLYQLFTNVCSADLQKDLINKLTKTKTLTFDFKQKISDKEEIGNCFIKYTLLIKCIYKNLKKKTIISNGKTVAIIKKKYKKIYYYPLKSTPLFFILQKEKIINLVRKTKHLKISENLISKKEKITNIINERIFEIESKHKIIFLNKIEKIILNESKNKKIKKEIKKII